MSARLAFVLNLDAELELERGGRPYQRTREIAQRVETVARAMRPTLPRTSTVIDPLGEEPEPGSVPVAWSPTPSALAAIRRAGLVVPALPSLEVLARVNARPFAAALAGDELAGAVLAHDLEAARAALARPGSWLLKRSFGVSGRGQRPVRGGEATEPDLAFVAASLRNDGALAIEPRVAIERELSVHAWAIGGRTQIRSIRAPIVDAHRAFVSSAHAEGLDTGLRDALERTAERVGAALLEAGYFGPFGIDAFLHRQGGSGPLALRALSEINARYCMGWDETDGWTPPASGLRGE